MKMEDRLRLYLQNSKAIGEHIFDKFILNCLISIKKLSFIYHPKNDLLFFNSFIVLYYLSIYYTLFNLLYTSNLLA
jgi:hypothetical protein